MHCTSCGVELAEGAGFCTSCGTAVIAPPEKKKETMTLTGCLLPQRTALEPCSFAEICRRV